MPRRLLALIAAVAMVVIAVVARDRIDNGDNRDGGGGGSGPLRLVCATELQAVCEGIDDDGLEVTIEAAGATADRLESADLGDPGVDGWLAPGPWGELVDTIRAQGSGDLFDEQDDDDTLARSPFVVAVWKDKRNVLACAAIDLGCLGDAVRERGFRLGVATDDQAEGVLADAALGAGHIKDANFATNDLNETDLADWLTGVDVNVDRVTRNPGGRTFAELLTFGRAAADGFLSTEAVIGPQFAQAVSRAQFDLVYVSPVVTADVRFAAVRGERGDRLAEIVRGDRVRELLAQYGWRVPGHAPADGVKNTPQLPEDDGLPSAGVLQAIREVTN